MARWELPLTDVAETLPGDFDGNDDVDTSSVLRFFAISVLIEAALVSGPAHVYRAEQ